MHSTAFKHNEVKIWRESNKTSSPKHRSSAREPNARATQTTSRNPTEIGNTVPRWQNYAKKKLRKNRYDNDDPMYLEKNQQHHFFFQPGKIFIRKLFFMFHHLANSAIKSRGFTLIHQGKTTKKCKKPAKSSDPEPHTRMKKLLLDFK